MKIQVNTEALQTAVSTTSSSVASSVGGDSLTKCLLIRAMTFPLTGDVFSIVATNLDQVSRAVTQSVVVEEEGEILVDARLFSACLQFKEETTSIIYSDDLDFVSIECGKIRMKLPCAGGTFPTNGDTLNNIEWSEETSVSYLMDAINSVAYAASRESHQPKLCGILFSRDEQIGHSISNATDGHRMSRYVISDSPVPSMLLPISAIKAISKSLSKVEHCHIAKEKNGVAGCFAVKCYYPIGNGSVEVEHSFRLQEAENYPDIDGLIDKLLASGDYHDVELVLEPLKDALALAGLFHEHMRCILTFDADSATITAEGGSGACTINLEVVDGVPSKLLEPFQIGLNSRYLVDSLASSLTDTATIRLASPEDAIVITNPQKTDLIMPMRI